MTFAQSIVHGVTLTFLTLLCASVQAESSVSGRYHSNDYKATFNDIYAYRTTEEYFGEMREVTEVILSEEPLDKPAIAEGIANRGEDSTTKVLWSVVEGAFAQLTVTADSDASLYLYVPPGYNLNMSGVHIANISVNTPTRIEGEIVIDRSDADGPETLNATFATDIGGETTVSVPATPEDNDHDEGAPLPADGGEPGRVFLTAIAAQKSGDIDTMIGLSNAETKARIEAAREQPDFADMIEMIKEMTPDAVEITGGHQTAETATVKFNGIYNSGTTSTGTAALRKEGGQWTIEQISEQMSN